MKLDTWFLELKVSSVKICCMTPPFWWNCQHRVIIQRCKNVFLRNHGKTTVFKSRRVAEKVLKEVCVVTRRYIEHSMKPNWTWIIEEILPLIIGCVLRNAGSVPYSKKCRNNPYYITLKKYSYFQFLQVVLLWISFLPNIRCFHNWSDSIKTGVHKCTEMGQNRVLFKTLFKQYYSGSVY